MLISFTQRKQNLNQWNWTSTSLLSISDFHAPRAAICFPQQNFALQVLFSNSLGTNNRPLWNWKLTLYTILWENILHYLEHESRRWGFSLRVNPLKNWVLSDGSVGIFACSHFVQRMSITPHQISPRRRVVYSISHKKTHFSYHDTSVSHVPQVEGSLHERLSLVYRQHSEYQGHTDDSVG